MASHEAHKVAVFDINGTLYRKSSKEEFFKFICFKNGYKILDLYNVVLYKLLAKAHLINQKEFKENFFNYLDDLSPDVVEQYAREYWSIEYPRYFNHTLMNRIEQLRRDQVHILCISGGLDVYINPLFDSLKVDGFYCTRSTYLNHTYKIQGQACKGEEKIKRLEEHFQGEPYRLIEAYSDDPEELLDRAERAYLLNGEGEVNLYKPL